MNKYMITAWTFTTVLVSDAEFVGIDVVIGVYEGIDSDDAINKASNANNIPVAELKATQLL